MEQQRSAAFQFGAFQLDVLNGELRKHGIKIKLQEQPLQILVLLLEHSGEVVTREQIQHKLWPPDTYVDYDNAINSAMRKLREALGDDSEHPQFIETMARRGYRFIGHIETPHRIEEAPPAQTEPPAATVAPRRSRKGLIAGLSGAALLLAVASWWLLRPHLGANAGPLVPVPLTSASGWENDASISPDGNQVAYWWDQGKGSGNAHIFVKLIGEGKPVQLTFEPKPDYCPSWSPDGRTIAFVRGTDFPSLNVIRIYTIPALGGSERLVAEGSYFLVTGLSWSPDGRFLAVSENLPATSSSSLALVPVEGGAKVVLTKSPDSKTADANPVFSPSGRRLLFTRCLGDSPCGLYLLDLSKDYRPSGEPRQLRQERGSIYGATWTGDGRGVVYTVSEDSGLNYHLMQIRAETGSQPQRLTFAGNASEPAIAPRGNRLVYTQHLTEVDIWQVHPGEPPTKFISSTRWQEAPQFSPDGQRVAFASDRSGLMQIWVCDADGGNPIRLSHFELGSSGTPRWSPDGRWIAFDHQETGGWRIYVMAADGGQVRRLAEEKGSAEIPSWSYDGKWIYYASSQTGRFEIWKRPAEGGPAIQLTHNGGWVAFESPDGQSLYYGKSGSAGVWMRSLGGGEEKLILESVSERAFLPVDDGIYYLASIAADWSTTLRFRSFATAHEKEIARIKYAFQGIAVSPDRKTILFSAAGRTDSNIMVVDNFR